MAHIQAERRLRGRTVRPGKRPAQDVLLVQSRVNQDRRQGSRDAVGTTRGSKQLGADLRFSEREVPAAGYNMRAYVSGKGN